MNNKFELKVIEGKLGKTVGLVKLLLDEMDYMGNFKAFVYGKGIELDNNKDIEILILFEDNSRTAKDLLELDNAISENIEEQLEGEIDWAGVTSYNQDDFMESIKKEMFLEKNEIFETMVRFK